MGDMKVNVQHESLKPRLRPYQRQGVLWMLNKERFGQKQKDTSQTGANLIDDS